MSTVEGAPHRKNFRLPGSSDRTTNVKTLKMSAAAPSPQKDDPDVRWSPKQKKAANSMAPKQNAKEREAERLRLERLPIVHALASLRAAEAVTWVPYGMLRDPVIPEDQDPAARRAKRREEGRLRLIAEAAAERQRAEEEAALAAQRLATAATSASERRGSSRGGGSLPAALSRRKSGATPGGLRRPSEEGWDDGAVVEEEKVVKPVKLKPWEMDPAVNREGLEDLTLDDPRYVRAPGWQRVAGLRKLQTCGKKGDEEVLAVAIRLLKDTEGMVRAEALKTLCKVARRADEDRLPLLAAMALAGDKVADVRLEVCATLAVLAHPGKLPSKQMTGTSRDVDLMERDKEVVAALTPLLEDEMGYVRKAAAEALDVVNAGWQRFKHTEHRWDDGQEPLRDSRPLGSPRPRVLPRVWDKQYTHDDLLPLSVEEMAQARAERLAAKNYKQSLASSDPTKTTLGGCKYNTFNALLRRERFEQRFEIAQQKADKKVQLELKIVEPGERGLTTNWMGVEWVDRTQRVYLGEVKHPKGAGAKEGSRDTVAAPYQPGYSAFGTPLGYAYM